MSLAARLCPEAACLSGALIKEAIEDLEWGALSSSMTLRMQQSPAQIQLSGHDSGDISIQLPVLYGALTLRACSLPVASACAALLL